MALNVARIPALPDAALIGERADRMRVGTPRMNVDFNLRLVMLVGHWHRIGLQPEANSVFVEFASQHRQDVGELIVVAEHHDAVGAPGVEHGQVEAAIELCFADLLHVPPFLPERAGAGASEQVRRIHDESIGPRQLREDLKAIAEIKRGLAECLDAWVHRSSSLPSSRLCSSAKIIELPDLPI